MSEVLPTVALVLNEAPDRRLLPELPHRQADELAWRQLRDLVQAQAPLLSAPRPGLPGLCAVCHGPAAVGGARCFQCDLHCQLAPDSLADVVVPVAFAIKGGSHARHLWQYKSCRFGPPASPAMTAADTAAGLLLALLLVFLRDHGACVWRAAGMPGPTHLAVVPTARGRPGVHPLRALINPYLVTSWAELSARPGGHPVRDLDPARFTAQPLPGARVLLLDDTWTTGSTAQSAAMALRHAGARSVATVVLGRHVSAAMPGSGQPGCGVIRPGQCGLRGSASGLSEVGPESMPFRPERCAVHRGDRAAAEP